MNNDSQYFTVFGSFYIPERHRGNHPAVNLAQLKHHPSAVASWIVVCTLIAGISVFAAEIAYFATRAGGPSSSSLRKPGSRGIVL